MYLHSNEYVHVVVAAMSEVRKVKNCFHKFWSSLTGTMVPRDVYYLNEFYVVEITSKGPFNFNNDDNPE